MQNLYLYLIKNFEEIILNNLLFSHSHSMYNYIFRASLLLFCMYIFFIAAYVMLSDTVWSKIINRFFFSCNLFLFRFLPLALFLWFRCFLLSWFSTPLNHRWWPSCPRARKGILWECEILRDVNHSRWSDRRRRDAHTDTYRSNFRHTGKLSTKKIKKKLKEIYARACTIEFSHTTFRPVDISNSSSLTKYNRRGHIILRLVEFRYC